MPPPRNKPLRIMVPLVVMVAGIGVMIAVARNTANQRAARQVAQAQVEQQAAQEAVREQAPPVATDTPAPTDVASPPAPPQAETVVAPTGLRAESFEGDPLASSFAPLGGLGYDSPYEMRLEFTTLGAGVRSLRLADQLDSIKTDRAARKREPVADEHFVELQAERRVTWAGVDALGNAVTRTAAIAPMAALAVEVDGVLVPLADAVRPLWRQVSEGEPGRFEAFVVDAEGRRVLRVERRYTLAENANDVLLSQRVENLTERAMRVRLRVFGPGDLPEDHLGYGGDKRRVRFGYLAAPAVDPARQFVAASDFLWPRAKALGTRDKQTGLYPETLPSPLWPNDRAAEKSYELVWTGMTNRYFGVVMHPVIDLSAAMPRKTFDAVERIDRVVLNTGGTDPAMVLSLALREQVVPAGGAAAVDLGLYAGPLSRPIIRAHPMAAALGIDRIVVFNFGGMCAACTFAWLTEPLLSLMRLLHSLTHDWGLAIIFLVVVVRTILHPVTRFAQIRMQRFGKQMQGLAPKQKAIQEKFRNDKQRMQQEMARLWREEGVSPAGFLGCLPLFLQSPVWIALYATLYFAIELRHEPAFFGVFQAMTGAQWSFLGDLSEPDRAIYFGRTLFTIPLMGAISSLNILPLLLGVVFYVHQKYLTPPPSAAMTPEQEQQQKIMRIVSVVMFPVFMYNAPSGLSLYFITNSTLGIFESRWIRAHCEKHGLLDLDKIKAKKSGKKTGFMARLQEIAEQQRAKQEAARQGAAGARRVDPRAGRDRPDDTTRRYKKRR